MKSHTFSRYKPVSGKETPLAIHKVIEVISQSNKSWADAAEKAVKDASHTLKGLKSIYIQDMQGIVEKDKIVSYRINAKITFELEE